ncbi:MAG: YIP1 family protein [Candidatus Melainabacteria bacterium]|nr:YIP1 family protein [Candidatus Melainabacteria bacterium]
MDASTTINSEATQTYDGENPSWSELFYGILMHPITTFKRLDALCEIGSIYKLCMQAFSTVFLSACLLGLARITPTDGFGSFFDLVSALTNEMMLWVIAASVLSLLSAVIAGARPTKWKKALVLTGWSFVPLIFFAPIICFKNSLGAMVLPFIAIPTWWSLFLLFSAYKTALDISARKLLVLVVIVPPVLFLAYAFWSGLSFFLMLSEILSAFSAR